VDWVISEPGLSIGKGTTVPPFRSDTLIPLPSQRRPRSFAFFPLIFPYHPAPAKSGWDETGPLPHGIFVTCIFLAASEAAPPHVFSPTNTRFPLQLSVCIPLNKNRVHEICLYVVTSFYGRRKVFIISRQAHRLPHKVACRGAVKKVLAQGARNHLPD